MKNTAFAIISSAAAFSAVLAAPASADPLAGEVLKFQQLPLNGGLPPTIGGIQYPGHDELSTAHLQPNTPGFYLGDYMADDFADKVSTPVVHIKFWGSYLNGAAPAPSGVKQFLVAFESDVPAAVDATGVLVPSHPGQVLSQQIVNFGALSPASGTFTETALPTPTSSPEQLFQYNAELANPFAEKANTVYWLKIVALTADPALQWGWHNRDYSINDPFASTSPLVNPGEFNEGPAGAPPIWHFQDDAVAGRMGLLFNSAGTSFTLNQFDFNAENYHDGIDGPQGIGQYSKDLAFELYTTVPEPASIGFLGFAGLSLVRRRRR